MDLVQDIYIPPLRQDLKIYPGNHDFDGAPTWLIYDPLSDNYFKIGWFEFECLQRFEKAQTASQLVSIVNAQTSLSIDIQDVSEFIYFLIECGLIRANSPQVQQILQDKKEERKPSFIHQYFLRFIFVTVPFFKPQKFLNATFPYIRFLFSRPFFLSIMMLFAVGVFLTVQRLDEFAYSFTAFFSFENIILVFLATIVIKIVHEFGHAFMAHKYGVPVTTMGAIFIVFYPLFYTETTNAWRMYDRQKRLYIAAAGLMAEFCLAAIALMVWHISDPGLLRNLSYFIAFLSLSISILVNANPLMKFDGYYLLSDILGIDNLQTRAGAFFKWKLRRNALGLKHLPPEILPPKTGRFFVYFGLAQIIYRCFLFSAIAMAIYFIFFKPLGFILAFVALVAFLGMPLAKELYVWFQERDLILKNRAPKLLLFLLFVVVVLSVLPLSSTIKIPAVLHYKDYTALYVSTPAKVDKIHVQNLQTVKKGDILISLSSEQLEHSISAARLDLQLYQSIKKRQQAMPELSRDNVEIMQLIKEAQTRLSGLLDEQDNLRIKAPIDGIIKDLSSEIHVGRWVNSNLLLARVINKDALQVSAYVPSEQIKRIEPSARGSFQSDLSILKSMDLALIEVSSGDTNSIAYPELVSLYGGLIPADRDQESGEVISKTPLYVLRFSVDDTTQIEEFTQKGIVILQVRPISFFGNMLERFISLFLRETSI